MLIYIIRNVSKFYLKELTTIHDGWPCLQLMRDVSDFVRRPAVVTDRSVTFLSSFC
jgi:hypothetical protein